MDIIFPSRGRGSICWHWHWHWHSIRKAFPPCAGGASSIVDSLGGNNHSYVDPGDATTVNMRAARDVLPPNHPQTIRVRRIAAHLIATASECEDGKSRFGSLLDRIRWRPAVNGSGGGGVDWRVDVAVDEELVYAYSYDNGIVTVSTGFLDYMRTDADVAAVLGHEVAHVMARHGLKTRRNMFWVRFLVNFAAELLNVPRDRFTEDNWEFTFLRPWYFRKEYEADHLGLLLVAAAGYDPRIAPKAYEKLGRLQEMVRLAEGRRHSASDDGNNDHPACTERIRRLLQAEVMGEALDLYEQALSSGKGNRTQALDSWSSTFTFGLSWAHFWAQEWLQGVPNLWNSVRNSFISSRPRGHRNHVAHQVAPAPANWGCNKGGIAAAGSLSLRYGTDYVSSYWQLLNNDVHRAQHSAYVPGNTGSPCARLPWDQLVGARAQPEVKLFMWQLRHGKLWPADRSPHHPPSPAARR